MSRYRLVLPTGKAVEASLKVTTDASAKRWAKTWASSVGEAGTVRVDVTSGNGWAPVGQWQVRNSEATQWEGA